MTRIAVYTSIFGAYDGLLPQQRFPGVDYICFTDQPFKSKVWKIRNIEPRHEDPTRCSREIKVLPHKFLPDYKHSVFIDGNYLVKKNPSHYFNTQLKNTNVLVFDHNQCEDAWDCVYKEYDYLMALEKAGKRRDDPVVMKEQIERYKRDGYPENNSLIFSAVLLRNHLEADVVKTMERWWDEIQNGSKRDQLSFNYSAWKTGLSFEYLDGDLRNHEFVEQIGVHRSDYRGKYFRYRLKKLLGIKK